MATYVPGSQTYGREFQPFTPDYKFLSNVLEVRQDRYDTNYKQLSDLYSRVVYADLSREDTQSARDQYTEKLSPKIQQISGMDLSMRQNVDAAKGLFKPFYDDDLIVKDLVYTKAFKSSVQQANRLRTSQDLDERKRYWDTGMQYLEYQMDDFKNKGREEALSQGLPDYVENVDLISMSSKLLKDAGFGDIEIDVPGEYWMIREKNGPQMVPHAYNFLQKALLEDPNVIRAYRAQGYVASRNHAERGMEAGMYGSLQEGQLAWAQETLSDLANKNATANEVIKKQFEEALNAKENWENYQKESGIIPNSEEERLMIEALEKYEQTSGALERNERDLGVIENINENDDLLNTAFNLIMNYNLSSDILAAAKVNSMKNYSRQITGENPYTKMKIQHQHDIEEMREQHRLDMELAEREAELEGKVGGYTVDYANALFSGLESAGSFSTIEDELAMKDAMAANARDEREYHEETANKKVEFILAMNRFKNIGKPMTNEMTITLGNGEKYTGDYDDIRRKLLAQDGKGIFQNQSAITTEYKNAKLTLDGLTKNNPLVEKNYKEYHDLSNRLTEITHRDNILRNEKKIYRDILSKNFERVMTMESKEGVQAMKKALDRNIPFILKEVDGRTEIVGRDEFANTFVKRLEAGELKGMSVGDSQFSSAVPAGQPIEEGGPIILGGSTTAINPMMSYTTTYYSDEKARKVALKFYDEQKAVLNSTINGELATESALSPTQLFSTNAFFRGVDLEDMTESDLFTYQGERQTFSLSNLDNPRMRELMEQTIYHFKNVPDKLFMPANQFPESLSELQENVDLQNISKAILEAALYDVQGALNNPGSSKSEAVLVDFVYNPVITVGGKSFAGFTVRTPLETTEKVITKPSNRNNKTVQENKAASLQEITMLIPLEKDMSPGRAGNYQSSFVDTDIMLSEKGIFEYNVDNDYAGSFRIAKRDGKYYEQLQMKEWNSEKGVFDDIIGEEILLQDKNNQPLATNQLDAFAKAQMNMLFMLAQQNIAKKEAWKKQNPNKVQK